MKSYKEMADNVFSRIVEEKEMEIKKRHNRVYMASTMAVFGLAILIGVGIWLNGQIAVGEPGPVQGNNTQVGETQDGTENPGKNADYGEHEFSFAIYSHNNAFENSDVAEKAYCFANGERLEKQYDEFVDISAHDGVILESVKQSYDKKGVILRVSEEKGLEGKVELKIGFEYKNLYLVTPDSEDVIAELDETAFTLKPFEFVTVKII